MKKKIAIIILVGIGLFLGVSQVFGAVTYERTPSDYYIQNPVSFDVSWENYSVDVECEEGFDAYWGVGIKSYPGFENSFAEDKISSTTNSHIFSDNYPLGEKVRVSFFCFNEAGEFLAEGAELEYGPPEPPTPIFEIEGSPPITWLPLSKGFVAGIVNYVRAFVGSGIAPLLYVFIGIPFAFVVIKRVIALMPKK